MPNSTKNLLVICHDYRTFTKDLIEELSPNFGTTYVLVRYNSLFSFLNLVWKKKFGNKAIEYKIDFEDKPDNVEIITTNFFYLPHGFFFKIVGEMHLRAAIKQIEKRNLKFDLIHAHFTWSSGYVAAKLKEKYGIPAVITAHGYDIYELPFRNENWKEKISHLLNNVDYVLTVSQNNIGKIAILDVLTPRKLIPNGYKPQLFHPMDLYECREKLQLPHDKKILLSVGHIRKVKGYNHLIQALYDLSKKRNDIVSIIIGGGPLKNQIEKQIQDLGLEENVKLVGLKPHSEIPLWMGACDLFVLPSLNEGNPTVMFEALGCGRPFVGTNVGGVPDIIKDERLGIIVEPADPNALSDAICAGLKKTWDSSYIVNYSKQYTWENIAKATLDVYDKLLE